MHGTYSTKDAARPGTDLSGPLEIFTAFDGETKYRFDRTLPGMVIDSSTAKQDPNAPGAVLSVGMKKGTVTTKYFRNGKKTGRWASPNLQIEILPERGEGPPFGFGCLDVRALGLYHYIAIQQSLGLKELLDTHPPFEMLKEVDKSTPAVWVVTWLLRSPGSIRTNESKFWIDVDHGFTPTRLLHRYRDPRSETEPWRLAQEATTRWEQRGSVWVPVSYDFRATPPQTTIHYSFSVDWISINERIDSKVFDYEGFDAPDNVPVVDLSLGQPVMLRTPFPSSPMKRGIAPLGVILISGTIAIVLIVLVAYVRRGRTGSVIVRKDGFA